MRRLTRHLLPCLASTMLAGCGDGGGGPSNRVVVVPPPPPPTKGVTVSVGGSHTCGRSSSYTVYCWGGNGSGQLGIDTMVDTTAPTMHVAGLDDGIDGAFPAYAGARHTCARAYGNTILFDATCWGDNSSGQLGDGTRANKGLPVRVSRSASGDAIDGQYLSGGGRHTCGFSGDRPFCWGSNDSGQLGDGTNLDSAIPVAVALAGTIKLGHDTLTAGADHTCGLAGGVAYCWGANASGQLGNGTTSATALPVAVSGGLAFSTVSAGDRYSCGVAASRAAYCWGSNANGQLGNGSLTDSAIPVAVAGNLAFDSVSAADGHACGITPVGSAWCWGANDHGQLGDGTLVASATPQPVAMGLVFTLVRAGGAHSCGVTVNGDVYCWGNNASGQLGNGTTTSSAAPVKVRAML